MKQITSLLFLFIILTSLTGVFDLSITGLNGSTHTLGEYQGKKIAIIILPPTANSKDSTLLLKVDSIALANISRLKIIAVPSFDDGYTENNQKMLTNFYQSMIDSSILVSQPLYTHKTSGTQQDALFNWLTHVDRNTHFDNDVKGAGNLFLINEQGKLIGVFEPGALRNNKFLNRLLGVGK